MNSSLFRTPFHSRTRLAWALVLFSCAEAHAQPARFVFDAGLRAEPPLSAVFTREAAVRSESGEWIPAGQARFAPSRLLCGAPNVFTVPGTAAPVTNINVLATGVAADGSTPVWVVQNSDQGKLQVFIGALSGSGFTYDVTPNPSKGGLADGLRDSADADPSEVWVPKAFVVCHGIIVGEFNVATPDTVPSPWVARRVGFATCSIGDLAGPKPGWWRRHALSDELTVVAGNARLGAVWSMPQWFDLDQSGALPLRVYVPATDYRAAPGKDGGMFCIIPLSRPTTSDPWTPGPVLELGRYSYPGGTSSHAHAMSLTRLGDRGIAALGSRGDSVGYSSNLLWTLSDEDQLATGALPTPGAVNWLSGAPAWSGPRIVHGSPLPAPLPITGNQWAGVASGPVKGTIITGPDEMNDGLWMAAVDGSSSITYSPVYSPGPSNWIPAPGSPPTQTRILSLLVAKADPASTGGPYVAQLEPGQFDPEKSINARLVYSPDGINWGQMWAHRENEQTSPRIADGQVWVGSYGLSRKLGIRSSPLPATRLKRPLRIDPGGINLLASDSSPLGVSAGCAISPGAGPAPTVPGTGPAFHISAAPIVAGLPPDLGTLALGEVPGDAAVLRLRFFIRNDSPAEGGVPATLPIQVQLVSTSIDGQTVKTSGLTSTISVGVAGAWAPVILSTDLSTWGAQDGPATLSMVVRAGTPQLTALNFSISLDALVAGDVLPYSSSLGTPVPPEALDISGFAHAGDWTVLLAGQTPMYGWDRTFGAIRYIGRPFATLSGPSGVPSIVLSAEIGRSAITAWYLDEFGIVSGAQVERMYWQVGSPVLAALRYSAATRKLRLTVSAGGNEIDSSEISGIELPEGITSIRLVGDDGQPTPMEWFGGAVEGRRWSDTEVNTALRSLNFIPETTPCAADFNWDGFEDAIDYDAFLVQWLNTQPTADFDHDGFVDAIDFDGFVGAWLAGGC